MHIVHTEASCGWGGQEIRILTEAEGMMGRGHRVEIWAVPGSGILEQAARRDIPHRALPLARKRLGGVIAMRRALAQASPDVVNTHSSTDAWLVALACRTLRRPPPMVRTRHISAAVPRNFATRWLYTRATHTIVTTGEKLRQQLITENGFDPERIISIPTGVDTQKFSPGDKVSARTLLGLPPDVPLIGIVATLRSWKGHRYLIEALAGLPDKAARLLIVGDGPQRQNLADLIRNLGLTDRVMMAGNQTDVVPWLRSLDIFVLPSYANEGVPQAVMQAMLCGLPVITTSVGSIGEAVQHERTGLVCEAQNAAALRQAIGRLLADAALRRQLGEAAQAYACRHFGLGRMLDAMEALFHQLRRGG